MTRPQQLTPHSAINAALARGCASLGIKHMTNHGLRQWFPTPIPTLAASTIPAQPLACSGLISIYGPAVADFGTLVLKHKGIAFFGCGD